MFVFFLSSLFDFSNLLPSSPSLQMTTAYSWSGWSWTAREISLSAAIYTGDSIVSQIYFTQPIETCELLLSLWFWFWRISFNSSLFEIKKKIFFFLFKQTSCSHLKLELVVDGHLPLNGPSQRTTAIDKKFEYGWIAPLDMKHFCKQPSVIHLPRSNGVH